MSIKIKSLWNEKIMLHFRANAAEQSGNNNVKSSRYSATRSNLELMTDSASWADSTEYNLFSVED